MNIPVIKDIARGILAQPDSIFKLRKLTLKELYFQDGTIKTFVFTSKKPLEFRSGQFGVWILPRFVRGKPGRLFSIASASSEKEIIVTTYIGRSDFKQKMNQLRPGDTVYFNGPYGLFTLPEPLPETAVFVVGGIGVTPARSIVKQIHSQKLSTKAVLIHSADGEYPHRDEMERWLQTSAHFVTRETMPKRIAEVHEKYPNAIYYIAGPPAFNDSAEAKLRELGITTIKKDGFLGY